MDQTKKNREEEAAPVRLADITVNQPQPLEDANLNLTANREANHGGSSTRNKGDEEVGTSRTRSGGASVAIFRDRDIDRKDPDRDCSYDRYVKRSESSDPGFGFNGGSYPMQQLYVPAIVQLGSTRSPHQLSIDTPQQGFHPEYLKLLIPYNMKRSIRIPLVFSLLITIFSLISLFSITFLHPPNSMFYWVPRRNKLYALPAPTPSNFTAELCRLANSDPGGESLKKGIQDMLEGNLPLRRDQIRRHEPYTHHQLTWDPWDNDHVPHRLHSRKDYRNRIKVVPELRRLLRARIWSNNRRYNLSDLLNLPIGLESKPGNKHSSCAVVGNSGILLNSSHGEEIDRHDLVIRLNNARINGYEHHVGSRTGLSFINSHILIVCAKQAECFCHPYGENVPILMYFCQASHFIDYVACNSSSRKNRAPLLITDPGFDALCARIVKFYSLKKFAEESGQTDQLLANWGKIHNEKLFHYSSGFQAVMVALGICDRVSLFGFGKSDKAKHHYHTNQQKELDLHDYSAEYMIYRDLAQRPEAIPFLSDLGFKVPSVQIHF